MRSEAGIGLSLMTAASLPITTRQPPIRVDVRVEDELADFAAHDAPFRRQKGDERPADIAPATNCAQMTFGRTSGSPSGR
jgi:hypothetical protein